MTSHLENCHIRPVDRKASIKVQSKSAQWAEWHAFLVVMEELSHGKSP